MASSSGGTIQSVRLVGVGYHFGSAVVLRGLYGEMSSGRLHVIVGANGSGKTTLLRVMALLLRPSFGQVAYQPSLDADAFRRTLGWVSHDSLAYPDLSGEQNLRLAASLHGLDAGVAVSEMADRFRLGPFMRRPVRTMSRGQRQRVALARSLVHCPSLLLLDEPSTGLDQEGLDVLVAFVAEELAAGRLVVVVTHDPDLFSTLSPRLWRLDRGKWATQTR